MGASVNNDEQPVSVTFSLDRHNFEEYLTQQNSYQRGAKRFAEMFNQIPPPLFLNLQHEAGMAEMFKVKGELLKYSIHLYRQLEIVFNAAFGIEDSDIFPYYIEKLERLKNAINWNDCISQNYDFYATHDNPIIKSTSRGSSFPFKIKSGDFICSVSSHKWDPSKKSVNFSNKGKKFYFTFDPNYMRYQKVPDKKSKEFVEKLEIRLQGIINKIKNRPPSIEFPQREFLFKNIFYFNGSPKQLRPIAIDLNTNEKVYLNACSAIRYFRNLGSHNNYDNQSLSQKGYSLRLDYSERKYWENPELILQSNYFQQYLDMVFRCYIEHLNVPVF